MGFESIVQRICFYRMNPERDFPMASDEGQAIELEKMRKATSDFGEGKRNIQPEYQGIAAEGIRPEIARQMLKDQ